MASYPPLSCVCVALFERQQQWLRSRDVTTNDNTLRNIFLAHDLPWYSDIGYKVVNTPKPLQDWLMNFWESRGDEVRQVSDWEMSSTQTNFHEVQMMQVSMDRHDRTQKVCSGVLAEILNQKFHVKLYCAGKNC